MFDNLKDHFSKALRNISGQRYLTEKNIKELLREIRIALLEADVSLPVVRNFIDRVKEKSIGFKINKGFTPSQEFIRIVHNELTFEMGEKNQTLNLSGKKPEVLLIVGIQGSGKTTSVGKLGKYLCEKKKKKVLVVSIDIYRSAAIKQLEILSKEAGVDFFPSVSCQNPMNIVNAALNEASINLYDVLIVDTAGRLHTNKIMMEEIERVANLINPIEILFVVDAMTGQDAANTVKLFDEVIPLTGIILTKVDGDARGGAALSIRHVTGKPIKFLGVGENVKSLDPFYPERMASQILGMGDLLSLIEDIEEKIDRVQTDNFLGKLKKNKSLDLNDFLEQLHHIKRMGGIVNLMNRLPIIGAFHFGLKSKIDDRILISTEAIINSMTMKERSNPRIIKSSRKHRIALGCGMKVQDINRLLKQFEHIQCVIKKTRKSEFRDAIYNMMNGMVPSDFSKHRF